MSSSDPFVKFYSVLRSKSLAMDGIPFHSSAVRADDGNETAFREARTSNADPV